MAHRTLFKALLVLGGLVGLWSGGSSTAQAQDWTDFYHWPYTPPQTPGNGFENKQLYDRWYLYPREQRIVPQIQGPYYRNFYGGSRIFGQRHPNNFHGLNKMKFYTGYHHTLDVF